nr:hypothetical protein [[Clostridium] hylemonae]
MPAPLPQTPEEKTAFALEYKIAVWDVLAGCEIKGADDSSIRNPVANDLDVILKHAKIQAVFTTGTKAGQLYKNIVFQRMGSVWLLCRPKPGKLQNDI